MESYSLTMTCDPVTLTALRVGPESPRHDLGVTERRIADWIVSTLDDSPPPGASRSLLRQTRRATETEGWKHLRVTESQGTTVVILLDRSIVGDQDLREIGGELRALVASGLTRIVLDFDLVERCSSHFPGVVAQLAHSCTEKGGLLKICALRPQLSELFSLPGLKQVVPSAPDIASAVASGWPERPPLALPIGILAALKGRSGPASEGAGRGRAGDESPSSRPDESRSHRTTRAPHAPAPVARRIRLIVQSGQAEGRAIAVRGPRFVIGRDSTCQLRPQSPAIGRFHTVLAVRNGQVFVRDLGQANATVIDGRGLHNAETEVFDNTRLHVGPLQFLVKIEAEHAGESTTIEDMIARWLVEGEHRDAASGSAAGPSDDAMARSAPEEERIELEGVSGLEDVKCAVIQDVLVVTLMLPTLETESAVVQLRDALARLFEATAYRRVVVSLCNVPFLPSAAVGVLVAHMLRLEWAGGGLRLCHLQPAVMTVMKKIHLPMLVGTYPTLDEAVLAAWN